MSRHAPAPSRRRLLPAAIATGAVLLTAASLAAMHYGDAISPTVAQPTVTVTRAAPTPPPGRWLPTDLSPPHYAFGTETATSPLSAPVSAPQPSTVYRDRPVMVTRTAAPVTSYVDRPGPTVTETSTTTTTSTETTTLTALPELIEEEPAP